MSVVVSDTSPLHYLIAVRRAEVLAQLFSKVYVPSAVLRELSHPRAPANIREWVAKRPSWLEVCPLELPLDANLAAAVDQGEAEAIQLAEEKKADALVLDEWKGRAAAQGRGLPLTGTLGILGLAYQKGILDDPLPVVADMRNKGFRVHDQIVSRFEVLLNTRYAR